MKAFGITLAVLFVAFFAIKMVQTPSVSDIQPSTPQVAQQTAHEEKDLSQFSSDLGDFMLKTAVKDGAPKDDIDISANCKPDQGVYGTRCWIEITELTTGSVDKATAENVRRRGDGFVWDHES